MSNTTTRKVLEIGPHSRPNVLAKLDGRRREARLMQQVREDLLRHLGGSPSAVQARTAQKSPWETTMSTTVRKAGCRRGNSGGFAFLGPLAKENLRHQFDPPYGVEYDPAWRDDAKSSNGTIKRWEQFTGETATLETDGRTFAEITAARHQETA